MMRIVQLLVVAVTLAPSHGFAQSIIDTPQTTLSPIAGITGSIAPGQGAPSPYGSPGVYGAPSVYGTPGSYAGVPNGYAGAPNLGFPNTAPRVQFGSSPTLFDPYASGPQATMPSNVYPTAPGGVMPSPTTAPLGGLFSGGTGSGFSQAPPLFGGSGGLFGGAPNMVPSSTYGSPSGFGSSVYPPTAIPNGSPSTLFPGGLFQGGFAGGGAAGGFLNGGAGTVFRLMQGPRFRHTFINAGNGQHDLEINDSDVSVAFAFPNFLGLTRPLFVVPSFSLHLWDGPRGATGSDLPANAYSGFLDFGWQSDPNQMFGLELGVRVGAFTDFDTFNSDSIRILGKGLASFRLTPYTTFKAGVYYLDRNKVKLLPAGGFLWQPNPYSRFDVFFPQPKIARYLRTIGTRDVWWYATGDYGGGSWTVQRDNGTEDSIDINDIRVMFGFEWGLTNLIRAGRRSGFAEVGYVFDREVLYRKTPTNDFSSDDAWMVRIGFGY